MKKSTHSLPKRPAIRFTDRGIRGLKPDSARYEVFDNGRKGLGVRVSPKGTKTFFLSYRKNGRLSRISIGKYPDISVADAYDKMERYRKAIRKGEDPATTRRARKEAALRTPTVTQLADLYIERHAKRHKKSWREDERMLRKDVLPDWGNRKAQSIKRRDVIALLDQIVERGSPVTANRTFEVIRRMFSFAVERDLIETSPCYLVKAPSKEKSRQRVLSESEIRQLWIELDHTGISKPLEIALRLQLVTAQRRGEIITARWNHFSDDWWTIPETKNRLSHRVSLSHLAKNLLSELHEITGDSTWLFPNPSDTSHMTERAPTRALGRIRQQLSMEHFTPHDLRRTAASYMASLGVPRLVIGKILNHVESGITAVYDRHSYDQEKREALDKWAERLMEIVDGK